MATWITRKHIPALDGLRGVALLMVFFVHTIPLPAAQFPIAQRFIHLGHWGVDLFFCLSGFLITGILYAAKNDPHYFRNFYARRALRIFPLYYFFLILYYLLVVRFHIIHFGAQKTLETSQHLHWLWWYGTNIRIALLGHYLTASINHFWTLAVEEHFYLVWPLLVYCLSRRGLYRAILLLVVGALFLRVWLEMRGVSAFVVTSSTLCRVDAFAMGGAVSLLQVNPVWRLRLRRILPPSIVASGLLALICEEAGDKCKDTLGMTCTAIFFSLLIAFVVEGRGKTPSFLGLRPLRWIGKYSYALYVFHWPIQLGIARRFPLDQLASRLHSLPLAILANILVVGTLSCLAALTTWNLFEKHFVSLKRYFPESTLTPRESVPIKLMAA